MQKKYFLLSVLNQPCTYFNEWLRVLWRVVKKDSTFSLSVPSWFSKSPSYPSPQPFPYKLKHPSLPVSLRKEAAPTICYFSCQHNLSITTYPAGWDSVVDQMPLVLHLPTNSTAFHYLMKGSRFGTNAIYMMAWHLSRGGQSQRT